MTTLTRRNVLRLLGLGTLSALLPKTAIAADIYGSVCTRTVNGLSYSGQCRINTYGSGNAAGYAYVWSNSSSDRSTIGAIAYLYTSNGLLCAYSDPNYSQVSVSMHCAGYNLYLNNGTTFCYAHGDMGVMNPYSGVMSWYAMNPTSATAVLSLPSETLGSAYKTNPDGLTYGSGLLRLSLGAFPDLISAIGVNGTEGYVKKTDLQPADIIQNANIGSLHSSNYCRSIPVYAIDGTTVVDRFNIS